MQNSAFCFFQVKSFQIMNDQLCWEQRSIHCDDCHSPPQALRIGLDGDRSPPGRLTAVARSDPWTTPPAQVGLSGDVIRRRRFPWVVSDLWDNSRGTGYLRWDRRCEDRNPEENFFTPVRLSTAKMVFENRAFCDSPINCTVNWRISMMSGMSAILCVKSQFSAPGCRPGKDVHMPKTIAVVKLPEMLGNGSSHLVKLAGKIDSFSLLLRETPEGELKRSIEIQFHSMVFATRKEIRKYCPRYRSLPGEGILDFNTDCTSGQLEPGDLGQAPPPKRGRLCETYCRCR